MITPVVGLKTHIWNNNFKALLFLLLYPILITSIYISAAMLVGIVVMSSSKAHVNFMDIIETIIFNYWYIPYILLFLFLSFIYYRDKNRIDIPVGKNIVTRQNNPELYELLENLCISRGLNMPLLFIRDALSVNAYASGLSDHTYYIVLTSSLVEELNADEIECVLAHELTHIINKDTRLLYLTGAVTHIFSELSESFRISRMSEKEDEQASMHLYVTNTFMLYAVLSIVFKVANIGSLFASSLISKKREFIADAGAIELTKNPDSMISALKKIKFGGFHGLTMSLARKPLLLHSYDAINFFQTHPKIETRIKVIEEVCRIVPDIKTKEKVMKPWKRKIIKQATKHHEDDYGW